MNKENSHPSGILLVRKPTGISSFGVISAARRRLNTRKIGHAGTLDPFADGLLILAVNTATRALTDFLLSEKTYSTTILFGATSATLDPESEIIFSQNPPQIDQKKLENILQQDFSGEIFQTPPAFSAIKIQGKRAYELARKGKEVSIEPRKTEVISAEITDIFPAESFRHFPSVRLRLRVKSGFYVRSFARDLAEKYGTTGLCIALSREAIGHFSLKNSINIEEITPERILPVTPEMFPFSAVFLSEKEKSDFFHGKPITISSGKKGRVSVFSETGIWIGFAEISENLLLPKKVCKTSDHLQSFS